MCSIFMEYFWGVDIAYMLFSQRNITGSFHMAAKLADSWKLPSFDAPSPKKHTVILLRCFICCISAAPVAMQKPPPTTPFAPRLPRSKSAICMEPPLPRQYPLYLPSISAIILLRSIPLAIQWPWPRCVLVI